MAEPEVATKAPESDAAEDITQKAVKESLVPGDTPAETGPTLGVLGSCPKPHEQLLTFDRSTA